MLLCLHSDEKIPLVFFKKRKEKKGGGKKTQTFKIDSKKMEPDFFFV